jgi:hypothetical protein
MVDWQDVGREFQDIMMMLVTMSFDAAILTLLAIPSLLFLNWALIAAHKRGYIPEWTGITVRPRPQNPSTVDDSSTVP